MYYNKYSLADRNVKFFQNTMIMTISIIVSIQKKSTFFRFFLHLNQKNLAFYSLI
jgi:hypothetical protein